MIRNLQKMLLVPLLFWACSILSANAAVRITALPPTACDGMECSDTDAIVFVHGIYGDRDSFKNSTTQFDWPLQMPRQQNGLRRDVYYANYETFLAPWRAGKNASLATIAKGLFDAMEPIRRKRYRSINFVAHSLGGVIASEYLAIVAKTIGYSERSRTAFVVMLGTPGRGSDIARWGIRVKSALGFSDELLASLERDSANLLQVHERIREQVVTRSAVSRGGRGCREVAAHAAFELLPTNGIVVVDEASATHIVRTIYEAIDVARIHSVQGFSKNHGDIAKPEGLDDPVARWVEQRIARDLQRIAAHPLTGGRRLCEIE